MTPTKKYLEKCVNESKYLFVTTPKMKKRIVRLIMTHTKKPKKHQCNMNAGYDTGEIMADPRREYVRWCTVCKKVHRHRYDQPTSPKCSCMNLCNHQIEYACLCGKKKGRKS